MCEEKQRLLCQGIDVSNPFIFYLTLILFFGAKKTAEDHAEVKQRFKQHAALCEGCLKLLSWMPRLPVRAVVPQPAAFPEACVLRSLCGMLSPADDYGSRALSHNFHHYSQRSVSKKTLRVFQCHKLPCPKQSTKVISRDANTTTRRHKMHTTT